MINTGDKALAQPNTVGLIGDQDVQLDSRILPFSPNSGGKHLFHLIIKPDATKETRCEKCDPTGTSVHLLGWRLSTLDFVARFIIRGCFLAVVFSWRVRSRTTVRVRARPRVRGTGISPLSGTARWVRIITAGRLLKQAIMNKRIESSDSLSPGEERVVGN